MLVKTDHVIEKFETFLKDGVHFNQYQLDIKHDIVGALYIKKSEDKRPEWANFLDNLTGQKIEELKTRSSSAVLLIRINNNVFAFTFGYGRSMLDLKYFVQDFGLKTALNSLDPNGLRSIDTNTLEEQPIQKKTQSAREADSNVFGVDILKDILRSVTGQPRDSVEFKNISGSDAIYSFSHHMLISDLPIITEKLLELYNSELYKSSFSWVDNIRRVNDHATINSLNEKLLTAIKNKDRNIIITVPEILPWDDVKGFSFTRSKNKITPTIQTIGYLDTINTESVTVQSIKNDRLFVYDINGEYQEYSVYRCIYFEIFEEEITYILFNSIWYEIDNSFIKSVDNTLKQIALTDDIYPGVETWQEDGKEKIETEQDYNARASKELGYHLLDRKLIKSDKTTSPIELCDILSPNHQLIHVKNSKAGSSGYSHLIAQGYVSAKALVGDRNFRKNARKVLREVADSDTAQKLIPLDNIKSIKYEVIFIILGKEHKTIKDELPFFTKINLTRAYEDLTQIGYTVKIGAAPKIAKTEIN